MNCGCCHRDTGDVTLSPEEAGGDPVCVDCSIRIAEVIYDKQRLDNWRNRFDGSEPEEV